MFNWFRKKEKINEVVEESNISGIDAYPYASGEIPAVGDLISYGSRNIRFLITNIHEVADEYYIVSGDREIDPALCVLIGRMEFSNDLNQ